MSALRRDRKQLQAATPEISAWVSANAGAGKTQVLVNRIARLLLAGAEPASVLCLTYTNAAAAEMAARIYKTLGDWTSLGDDALRDTLVHIGVEKVGSRELKRARRLFALALDTPGGFKIQTIHGFCERILQLFPIEAGMAPGFQVLDDAQRKMLLQEARDKVLSAANAAPGSALSTALDFVSHYASADSLEPMLDQVLKSGIALETSGNNDQGKSIEQVLRRFFGIGEAITLSELQRDIASVDKRALASIASELSKDKGKKNQELGRLLIELLAENDSVRKTQLIKQVYFFSAKGNPKKYPEFSKTNRPNLQAEAQAIIDREYERLLPLMQQHDGLVRIEATQALFTIARAIVSDFVTAKEARAAYDFDDLIERTRALLTDKSASAWVLYKLDKAVEHVLIDEAQDTSPPQWEIMKAVTEEFFAGVGRERAGARTVFVVGDQKQSIFSFQGADVRIFEASRLYFAARARDALQMMENVPLTISYRTQGAVLQAVDAVFGQGMPARIALGIEGNEGLSHDPERKDKTGLVELWPLTLAGDKDDIDPWHAPLTLRETQTPQQQLARKIVSIIASWIGKRWLASRGRTVQPQDILILFRSRSHLFELLISALREAGVPVSGTDRLKPALNIAVLDMLALMRVVTQPLDEYSLACVLKSTLVSRPVSEEELFTLCHDRGPASLWTRLESSTSENVRTCFAELTSYREQARSLQPFEFIQHVLVLRRKDILARLGREADDALAALSEQALEYEKSRTASINGFAEWFRAEDLEIKRDMDSGNGEVRLMTVHGAKGLEADIVFLADAANPDRGNRDRLLFVAPDGGAGDTPLWKLKGLVDSPAIEKLKAEIEILEQSEHCRLLYVAMTRARDELYICGAAKKSDGNEDTWYGMAEAALKASTLMREVETAGGETLLRTGADPVWQDEPPAKPNIAANLPEWLTKPFVAETARPRMTPTRLANPEGTVHSPTRARAGRILHRILERLPELPAEQWRGFAERHMTRNGLDSGLADRLLQILEGPDAEILFGPGSAAEVDVGAKLPGGILSGTIDRLVIREDGIWIVDYKSDTRVPSRLSADHPHLRQLAGYCYSLQMMHPGRPVRAAILWLSECRLEWADASELETTLAELQGLKAFTKA